MPTDPRTDLLLDLFLHLRGAGLPLGFAELLAARRALDTGRAGADDDSFKRLLRLLWCKSPSENAALDGQADTLLARQRAAAPAPPAPEPPPAPVPPPDAPPAPLPARPPPSPAPAPVVMPLPVRAPAPPTPPPARETAALVTQDPVSRRTMAYTWRYLRRPVKDGPCDQLDLTATVERAARQGYFDRPVLTRRGTDHGHLVLLVDQGGSMVPFHRLTRDLVQTAVAAGLGQVDLGYFQNVPPPLVYADPHRTRPLELARLLADCTPRSSVLLVSDAGAARGGRVQQRFQDTARVLVELKRLTGALAWLNPVPAERWPGTTAQLIALLVPMFPMTTDGFGNAVDTLRGLGGRAGR